MFKDEFENIEWERYDKGFELVGVNGGRQDGGVGGVSWLEVQGELSDEVGYYSG